MNIKFSIAAVILLQLIVNSVLSQNNEHKFNLVKGDKEKSLGKIRNMTQDPYGYMWFAGEGAKCIYRYDGNRITTFRHDDSNPNSLGGTSINSVYADVSGMIWIGFNDAGLDQLNPATGTFKHFRSVPNNPDSLGGAVTPVLRDRLGRLWIGTDNGLDQLDEKTGKFIHYRNKPGDPRSLSSNQVINIYEDHQGVIWIGTNYPWGGKGQDEGGLNRLETDGAFTRFMHDPKNPHSLISNKVRAIFEDSRGVFWVGTAGDGLHTMDRKTGQFERHTYDPSMPDKLSRPPLRNDPWLKANDKAWLRANDQVTFITEDNVGSIWIGSMFAGINRYDTLTKKITHYEGSNGFPDSSSWNAFQSRDGELWISTQDNNLYRVDPFHKTIRSINTGEEAFKFLEDKQGFLWVGTKGNGIFKFDNQLNFIQQFKNNALDSLSPPDNTARPLFQDHKNRIWITTDKGMRIVNQGSQKFSRFDVDGDLRSFNDTGASNILQDKEGLIWFSRWGQGLVRYNPKDHSVKYFYSNERDSSTISKNNVGEVFEDRSGMLWAGTNNGMNRLDKKTGKFVRYLAGNGIWALHLYQDSNDNLWAGTDKGLYRYDKKEDRFLNFFDSQSEFGSLSVGGVTEDDAKNLWFFSASAIIRLNLPTKQTFIYGSKYGIPQFSMETWQSVYKNGKGQMFIPNGVGFYTFSPEDLAVKTDFKIITTEILINSQPVLHGKGSSTHTPVEKISDLDLKYNQNNVTFNFAAIDYREPETIKYFTMLENYDNTWREVKGDKNSYYFNLLPGKYVYRVKAYNSDGTKAEKAITIYINPPLWETWWAYAVYALLLLAAIFGIYRYQKQHIIQVERQKRQQFELAQAKEIEKAYTELKATQAQLIQSEKMASLGELTAGIAHEIQNPLNFVNNFSEVSNELIEEMNAELDKGNTKEAKAIADDLKQNLEKINHHGKRADAIVKGMLQHSRVSTGVKEPTDINALAEEYLRLAYHARLPARAGTDGNGAVGQGLRAKDKTFNATLKTDFDPTIGNINVVSQDIGRVILNLINNAFYAVAEKKNQHPDKYEPIVSVSTKKVKDSIEIRVEDNGNGVPQKVLDKIFQPFFTTKPAGQGTGLGLSLSYDIIKTHGGEIKVENLPTGRQAKEGEGASFLIILPVEEKK